jgi:hypothetical protein
VLRIHILGIISYLVMFFIMTPTIGLNGPGIAAILASLLSLVLTARLIAKS